MEKSRRYLYTEVNKDLFYIEYTDTLARSLCIDSERAPCRYNNREEFPLYRQFLET